MNHVGYSFKLFVPILHFDTLKMCSCSRCGSMIPKDNLWVELCGITKWNSIVSRHNSWAIFVGLFARFNLMHLISSKLVFLLFRKVSNFVLRGHFGLMKFGGFSDKYQHVSLLLLLICFVGNFWVWLLDTEYTRSHQRTQLQFKCMNPAIAPTFVAETIEASKQKQKQSLSWTQKMGSSKKKTEAEPELESENWMTGGTLSLGTQIQWETTGRKKKKKIIFRWHLSKGHIRQTNCAVQFPQKSVPASIGS